jgi:hypothetical protein
MEQMASAYINAKINHVTTEMGTAQGIALKRYEYVTG